MEKLKTLFSLEGIRIIVTGASGGLGLSQALLMAELGAEVFALSRTGRTKEDISIPSNLDLRFIETDVTNAKQVTSVFNEIGASGGIDVLVNNAGITMKKRAEEVTEESWIKIHEVNVNAVYRCCKAAYSWLKKSTHTGRIINISSMASYFGFSKVVPYSSSKTAVLGITRGLAVEWSSDNILVNSVSPGWFPSKLVEQVMDEERKIKILSRMPLHRFGEKEELAAMVCFLASPSATYITGQDFSVDGGARAFGY
ncbi:SDR family NAD(P)-dependent oxidoreductase [Autumnicola musiva]|uniref:SDR family oxidoreductase n=1 Tax=Autumnicola musiva TaxID=3075589 RepID=A0ABU3D7W6_9FLAO|nr:SDR family oxidoreductase [Zunongwangia sp. F117]MDT0677625.1 SDR family oxidoreductase [Zunongwangia sp. F117]